MFTITSSKGFQITFQNGWTVSVQFGPNNYCDAWNLPIDPMFRTSTTAEVAILDNHGDFRHEPGFVDDVRCYITPIELLEILTWTAAQPREP